MRIHDRGILDALEALSRSRFVAPFGGSRVKAGNRFRALWPMVVEQKATNSRFCTQVWNAKVRWPKSATAVLEPVWPSRIEHEIHATAVEAKRTLRFADTTDLAPLGIDAARYRTFEYAATQAIAAARSSLNLTG